MSIPTELKAAYREELSKVWHGSQKMVDHCMKTTGDLFEYQGHFFTVDKPSISTDFCFPAGMNGRATEEEQDRAEHMAEYAASSTEYFKAENMRELDRCIESLQELRENMGLQWAAGSMPHTMLATGVKYYSSPADCRLYGWSLVSSWRGPGDFAFTWDPDLVDLLIASHQRVRADFEKRLNNYLKRYGLSKVNTWSFISD